MFKIDENLPESAKRLFQSYGYDCHSVFDEGIEGGSDSKLIDICHHEGRHLVTLDLDFGDIVTYPPEKYSGIIVLRLSHQDSHSVVSRLSEVMSELETLELVGHLVIVGDRRIRYR